MLLAHFERKADKRKELHAGSELNVCYCT